MSFRHLGVQVSTLPLKVYEWQSFFERYESEIGGKWIPMILIRHNLQTMSTFGLLNKYPCF